MHKEKASRKEKETIMKVSLILKLYYFKQLLVFRIKMFLYHPTVVTKPTILYNLFYGLAHVISVCMYFSIQIFWKFDHLKQP